MFKQEYLILIIEYIVLFIIVKKFYITSDYSSIEKLNMLYEFITRYHLTRSIMYSASLFSEGTLRGLIKNKIKEINIPVSKHRNIIAPVYSEKEIAITKIESILNTILNYYKEYVNRIEIISIFLIGTLIFPPLLALALVSFINIGVIILTPIIQGGILIYLVRKLK